MNTKLCAELSAWKESGDMSPFYARNVWKETARAVRRLDRYECQLCKLKGRYSRGVIVHHVKHLEDRPDLALAIFDPDTGERQLITLCKKCHEAQHPESLLVCSASEPVTVERWD